MKTINIATDTGALRTVKAKEIQLAGQGDLRLFLHESDGLKKYALTEYLSGCQCAEGNTEEECRIKMFKILKKYKINYIIEHSKKICEKQGFTYPINK